MGERLTAELLSAGDRPRVRERLDRSVEVLRRMVADGWLGCHEDSVGVELELNLVDPMGRPRLVNDEVLAYLARADLQYELSQFNLEFNLAPRPMGGAVLRNLEAELVRVVQDASAQAEHLLGTRIVPIGMLPTLRPEHLTYEHLSHNPRYEVLSSQMRALRGEAICLDITGVERLTFESETVAPEAAATSLQLHLRVRPQDLPRFYNAAQLISGAQVAVGANSPFLLGHQLWHETRIALCEQILDTRPRELREQGVRPRVWLGEAWVRSATEVFEDNVRYFGPLIPLLDPQDPVEELAAGRVPLLHELRLHNGTIWRWNRPVYDVQAGTPHLRIENRVLPSGPTGADMAANAALFFGAIRALADGELDRSILPFTTVVADFHAAARDGLAAAVNWRGRGRVELRRLVLDELLPLAAAGLDSWGIDCRDRDRYLGILERRADTGRTGAVWQCRTVARLERERGFPRDLALREMTRRYVEHAISGEPVHTWPEEN
jgi:hypothetical protein